MNTFRIAIALLLFALLAACTDTIFENPPSEKMSACDAHFVGKWRLLSPDSKSDDALYVIVEPACKRWRFIEDGKDDEKTEKTVHIAFASLANQPLLALKVDEDSKPNDPQARWRNGYYFLRYEVVDKSIRLHHVDDKRIAHLIVDGAIHGRSERINTKHAAPAPPAQSDSRAQGDWNTASDELHNFVAGDSAEMARVAQLEGIFVAADPYVLKPATDAEIFKPAQAPAKP